MAFTTKMNLLVDSPLLVHLQRTRTRTRRTTTSTETSRTWTCTNFVEIAANDNPDVAALILRNVLYTVVGIDDDKLDTLTKDWVNAHYDKKTAKSMAKMPKIWLMHKMGQSIEAWKSRNGRDAWKGLAGN